MTLRLFIWWALGYMLAWDSLSRIPTRSVFIAETIPLELRLQLSVSVACVSCVLKAFRLRNEQ